MKDYYKILELDVSATLRDIKKAYRRLAQQYHPDKNPDDPYGSARFNEIKEAYEVLTNPQKKEHYLEQRWFQQSMGRKKTRDIITPVTVLKSVLEFDRYVSKLDVHRMDKEGMYRYISTELINNEITDQLNKFQEVEANDQIASLLLKNISVIPVYQLKSFEAILSKLALSETKKLQLKSDITKFENQQKRERFMPFYILLVVIIISLLIYFVSR